MSAQREAFEAHLNARGLMTTKWEIGPDDYYFDAVQEAWLAWRAAQAAMPVAEPAGWISVDDRLPKLWDEVMVWPYPSTYCTTAAYSEVRGWIYTVLEPDHGGKDYACDVSHWMPVPDGPIDARIARNAKAAP